VKTAIAENSNSNVNQHAQNHHFKSKKTVLVADAGAVFCLAFGGALGCGMMLLKNFSYIWRK